MTNPNQRALIAAYFLSRFDKKGVRSLGYANFTEAFEAIGTALDVKPSTVKHMRDSFDPYCSQVRVGWYQRTILPSRANVIAAYVSLSEEAVTGIVRELLTETSSDSDVFSYLAPLSKASIVNESAVDAETTPYAARIKTGEEAEDFFQSSYPKLTIFSGAMLEDMRKLGVGFDFRANFPKHYSVIEVKGLRVAQGAISFTDKEWGVAGILGDDYYLALVRSLDTAPELELIKNPVKQVPVKRKTLESVSVTWNAYL
ncbi:protein NO VEIN domain-containing protein [Armatimonas sp.]|uniref:protein NO VEIN domain-containing protein n=1 Tax=Armatimonas sp. TaxID=1872638 RepID=UPI003751B38C